MLPPDDDVVAAGCISCVVAIWKLLGGGGGELIRRGKGGSAETHTTLAACCWQTDAATVVVHTVQACMHGLVCGHDCVPGGWGAASRSMLQGPLTNRVSAASHQVLQVRICVMHPALQVLYTRVE